MKIDLHDIDPALLDQAIASGIVKTTVTGTGKNGTPTRITVEIVSKIAGQSGFVVLPRRWVVERFFAWVNRNRRLAKDVEATLKSAAAFLYAAAAMLMLRRLARSA